MKTPNHFVSSLVSWDNWISTQSVPAHNQYDCGSRRMHTHLNKTDVERMYPGFNKTYDVLTSLGCDNYFVTCVLKHCIIHANGAPLDTFFAQAEMQKAVETALSLGLSGYDLVAALTEANTTHPIVKLPKDIESGPQS